MATQVQNRRGSTAEHSTFTGAVGEVTVDTDKEVVVVHDGTTAGGYPQMRENGSNSALALGSAATPSLKFTGDTNTGIYSPGADQVAISTNGTGRLLVKTVGDTEIVGTPNWNFAGLAVRRTSSNTANSKALSFLLDGDALNSTNLYSNVNFVLRTDSAPTTGSTSTGLNTGLEITSPATVRFGTNGSERLRIDSSGQVGIGTTSPQAIFHLSAATNTRNNAYIQGSEYGIRLGNKASVGASIDGVDNTTGVASYQPLFVNGSTLILGTGDTERARIDSSGRLGIGTTSPAAPLHVAGTVRVGAADTSDANLQIGNGLSGNRASYLDLTGDTTYSSYGLRVLRNNSGANASSQILHRGTGNLDILTQEVAPIIFGINNSERARIDSSGRLLVGTSSAFDGVTIQTSAASAGLAVQSGSDPVLLTRFTAADTGPFIFMAKSRSATIGTNTIVNENDSLGGLLFRGADGTNYVNAARIAAQVDGTPGANDMPGRLVFSTTADGASSPTERLRITSAGNVGIGSTPLAKFHVSQGADNSNIAYIQGASYAIRLGTNVTAATIEGVDATSGFGSYQPLSVGGSDLRLGSGGTERARIDSSGRLLVGTSSSSQGTCRLLIQGNANGAGNAGGLFITRGDATPADGVNIGVISFADSGQLSSSNITAKRDGGTWTSGSSQPTRLEFSTTADGASSPTERLRIDSAGLSSFTTNTGAGAVAKFDNTANTSTDQGIQILMGANAIVATARFITCAQKGVADRLIVYGTGNVQNTNNSYGALSDIKLKENIVDANSQWSDIKALQVRKYNFKEGQTHTQIGLIAQEVELVSPGLVSESPDLDEKGNDIGTVTKGVNYSVLYMKAVKALQEAMERIETLEAKVAALEAA